MYNLCSFSKSKTDFQFEPFSALSVLNQTKRHEISFHALVAPWWFIRFCVNRHPFFNEEVPMRSGKIASLLIAACLSAGLSRLGPAALAQVTILHGETPDERMGRLMREAAGLQPIHQRTIYPELYLRERRSDDSAREQFRNWFDLNRTYYEAQDKFDLSQVDTIGSFVDPAMGLAAVKQVHASYDLRVAQEKRVKEVIDKLRQALTSYARSPAEEQRISKSFEQGLAATIPRRRRVVEAEKLWLDAVDKEYAYARAHAPDFFLSQGRLSTRDPDIGREFNAYLNQQQTQYYAFLKALTQFEQFQADMLQKMGMSAKDAGIK